MPVTVDDLVVAIGDQSARLRPSEAFRLAERLIRGATVKMIEEETDRASGSRPHVSVENE